MESSNEQGGARGAQYTDDHGELHDIEQGVDSLGTPAAGAGVAAATVTPADAATAPRTLDNAEPPAVLFTSDAGEQTAVEQGVQLTEVGEQQVSGGSGETH